MKTITLAGTSLTMSKFIFGTASLFTAGDRKKRMAVLDAAVDNGFTHFDTAPSYGFGMAERDLSGVFKRHPQLTVTTKIGLHSPGGEEQTALSVFLRKAAGKVLPALSRPTVDFSVARGQRTLEGSLRRLGRDRIDIYALHEPSLELLQTEEWLRWLEGRRAAGQVCYYGLALTVDRLAPFLRANSPLAEVIQMADSLDRCEADMLGQFGKPMQITYAYVTAARARRDARSVEAVLRAAVGRNPGGAIIVSTKQPGRMGQYRALLDSPP